MECELEELDRQIEEELKQISEMTHEESESLKRKEHKVDKLNNQTTVQIENEISKSKYYVNVRLQEIYCLNHIL
jgi:ElaB/YqjD/DUF883 family membrane-anchored ribosome-binding protein